MKEKNEKRGAALVIGDSRRRVTRLVTVGIMSALAVALVYMVHVPIIPAVSFLEYDPADIPIFVVTSLFGWPWGLVMTVIVSVLQGITVSSGSGIYGIVMHIFATGSFVVAAGISKNLIDKLYKNKSRERMPSLLISFVFGFVAMIAMMAVCNYIITPYYLHYKVGIQTVYAARQIVVSLFPEIILFNVIKGGANALISYALFFSGRLAAIGLKK